MAIVHRFFEVQLPSNFDGIFSFKLDKRKRIITIDLKFIWCINMGLLT